MPRLPANQTGTVEERVLDVSSRKRLGRLQGSTPEESSTSPSPSLRLQLDQSEAQGLQQHLGKLLERRGVGEVVETGEIWKCLFGNAEHNNARLQLLKEVQRDQRAAAAEARMTAMISQWYLVSCVSRFPLNICTYRRIIIYPHFRYWICFPFGIFALTIHTTTSS